MGELAESCHELGRKGVVGLTARSLVRSTWTILCPGGSAKLSHAHFAFAWLMAPGQCKLLQDGAGQPVIITIRSANWMWTGLQRRRAMSVTTIARGSVRIKVKRVDRVSCAACVVNEASWVGPDHHIVRMDVRVHDAGSVEHLQRRRDVEVEFYDLGGAKSCAGNRPEPRHEGPRSIGRIHCGNDRQCRHSPKPGQLSLPLDFVLLTNGANDVVGIGLAGVHL